MSVERFTIDTNILVHSVDKSVGKRHEIAVDIIERSVARSSCLTLQSISEFFAATTRKGRISRQHAAVMARAWLDMFLIVSASKKVALVALEHAAAGRASYWNGLLIATAAEAGCSAIMTEDMADGAVLSGVRIINPFTSAGLSEAANRILAIPV